MKRNQALHSWMITTGLTAASLAVSPVVSQATLPPERPNVVIIFLDDAGWADFHPFGNPPYETPHVQRLADEGCRFDNFILSQGICSASRAALLTGCYPGRTKMFGAHKPRERGLDPSFPTMGTVFQGAGYTTGWVGKWHLGDQPETRPDRRGFNETEGIMYSNDMWEYHPTAPDVWGEHPLQYWRDGRVIEERVTPEFQKSLTQRTAAFAVDFIDRHKNDPFLLYVAPVMPHVPLFCSDAFLGKSGAGLYGDVILELDDLVGKIVKALAENGLENKTIILFSSDNGPWTVHGNHAGKTPFREAKATSFNGGIQSALLVKYPAKISAGSRVDHLFGSVDILPTLAHLCGIELRDMTVDGKNVWPLMSGQPDAENPHLYYPISNIDRFEAVISGDGRWKLHLPHGYQHVIEPGQDGVPGRFEDRKIDLSLFDLKTDPGETTNVITQHPEVVEHLMKLAKQHQQRFYAEKLDE